MLLSGWSLSAEKAHTGGGLSLALSGVTATVAHFVAVEVSGRMLMACLGPVARMRHSTVIAVAGVEVVIDMTVEVCGAVEPWTCTEEDAAGKPLRTIVAIGSAAIGSGVVVAVRAVRGDADVDADLSLSFRGGCKESKTSYSS
jgi:hypothetical protein